MVHVAKSKGRLAYACLEDDGDVRVTRNGT